MYLYASNGLYLTAENGGGINGDPDRGPARDDALIADRTQSDVDKYGDSWQQFILLRNTDGTISIKIGQWYVTAERGGGSYVSTDRDVNEAWQRFTAFNHDGGLSFLCHDGVHYLGMRTDSDRPIIDASATQPDGTAVFTTDGDSFGLLPHFTINGIDFIDAVTGQRLVLNGVDQFRALRMLIDGVDLSSLINESHELQFNLWRVFCQGSIAQNGLLELRPQDTPDYYDYVVNLGLQLNEAGIIPLYTCFVDNQDVKLGADHWSTLCTVIRNAHLVALVSGGNEWPKNGFDPASLADAALSFWSRGSSLGDEDPFEAPPKSGHYYGANGATFMEFHPRRDYPKSLDDSVASANFFYETKRYGLPLVIDEPPRMGTDGSGDVYLNPAMVWKFARNYATMCAAAVFHSRAGQQGVLMDAPTRACAQAWSNGMLI